MHLTAFAPVFAVMLLIACLSVRWWLAVSLLASFFQGATPLLISGGGRSNGIAPAYALLLVGALHFALFVLRQPGATGPARRDTAPIYWLATLTAAGAGGALLLPRVFANVIEVIPPRWGLDAYITAPLRPSGGNLIQAGYLICNFALFFLSSRFVSRGQADAGQALRALTCGAVLCALLGLYQVLAFDWHLPWPAAVINSNTGVKQSFGQSVLGVKRMSATFFEPSMFAMHFLGMFAMFAIGLRRWLLAAVMLLCLLLSTSTSAYVGLALLGVVWVSTQARSVDVRALGWFLVSVAAAGAVALLIVNLPQALQWARDHDLSAKLSGESGQARTHADRVAVEALIRSFGVGIGAGGTRASSLLANIAANIGLTGLVALSGFFWTLLRQTLRGSQSAPVRACGWALTGMLIGWAVSVPDIAMPLPWLLAGVAYGGAGAGADAADPAATRALALTRTWQTAADRGVVHGRH